MAPPQSKSTINALIIAFIESILSRHLQTTSPLEIFPVCGKISFWITLISEEQMKWAEEQKEKMIRSYLSKYYPAVSTNAQMSIADYFQKIVGENDYQYYHYFLLAEDLKYLTKKCHAIDMAAYDVHIKSVPQTDSIPTARSPPKLRRSQKINC